MSTVFFSGGSFRSASACAGVVAYLSATDRWDGDATHDGGDAVERVYSVSGGSFLNGALVASPPGESIFVTLGAFIERIASDGGRPWKTRRRLVALVLFLAAMLGIGVLLALAFGFELGSTSMPAALRVAVGLFALPAAVLGFRGFFAAMTLDMARVAVGGPVTTQPCDRRRSHVICSAGLQTGTPHLVEWPYWSQRALLRPTWGVRVRGRESNGAECRRPDHDHGDGCAASRARLQAEDEGLGQLSAIEAVYASTSLPGAGRQRLRVPGAKRAELLVDGGVVGTFGDSASVASGDSSRTLAIDGSRHVAIESGLGGRLRGVSYIMLLMRWLWVGFEATYVNDLEDRRPRRLLRVCMPIENPTSRFEHRLDDLRRRTSRIGLVGFGSEAANVAVACGAVSAAVWFNDIDPQSASAERRCEHLLRTLGERLGLGTGLVDVWNSTASVLFFAEQGRFVMSHEGEIDKKRGEHMSAAGYELAYASGYRCMQADLVLRDGVLVVGHAALGRSVPIPGPWFRVPDGAEAWHDVVSRFDARDVYWNIEVKSNQTEDRLVEFLQKEHDADRLHRYCISAPLRTRLGQRIRRRVPEVATNDSIVEGALIGRPLSIRPRTRKTTARGCQLASFGSAFTGRAALKRMRYVQIWPSDTIVDARRAFDQGAWGVISDTHSLADDMQEQLS